MRWFDSSTDTAYDYCELYHQHPCRRSCLTITSYPNNSERKLFRQVYKLAREHWIMTSTEQSSLWLLLLTHAPSPTSLANFRSLYAQPLVESLEKLSQITKSTSVIQTLDVVIPFPGLKDDVPRSAQYTDLQNVLCQLYKLLCVIYMEHSIDVEYGNDVEFRVIPLGVDTSSIETKAKGASPSTSTLSLASTSELRLLASCQRPWKRLLVVEDEGGSLLDTLLQDRMTSGQQAFQTLTIGKGHPGKHVIDLKQSPTQESRKRRNLSSRHYSVAVGGTFDHLHAGHKLLLTMTALILEPHSPGKPDKKRSLTIGITGDKLLVKKKCVEELQEWDQRLDGVRSFLSATLILDAPDRVLLSTKRTVNSESGARTVQDEFKSDLVINYVEIFDAFGPTITDEEISALVVSGETRSGGKAVNDRRSEKGWAVVEVFEVTVLHAGDDKDSESDNSMEQDFQNKISSTAIRQKLHLRGGRGTAVT